MKMMATALIAVFLLLIIAGCTQAPANSGTLTPTQTLSSGTSVGILYSKGVGPMPMLLATKQVDGYIAWQPFVSIASEANIGKVVDYSGQTSS